MTIFDKLVDSAMMNNDMNNIRTVVEKELLHHDIIREMSKGNLLKNLVFIGGTSLRACYGAQRLSEDLDFTGGFDFQKEDLEKLGQVISTRLKRKYNLKISVTDPIREIGNTKTWKIKIITNENKSIPAQKINIDICAIPSYQVQPMTLINHYGVDMGTNGLIISVESREEILVDKIIAFAFRSNKIKNRDLWDIAWLKQNNIKPSLKFLEQKIKNQNYEIDDFIQKVNIRLNEMKNSEEIKKSFEKEMTRFLPLKIVKTTLYQDGFWQYIQNQIEEEVKKSILFLSNKNNIKFKMQ